MQASLLFRSSAGTSYIRDKSVLNSNYEVTLTTKKQSLSSSFNHEEDLSGGGKLVN